MITHKLRSSLLLTMTSFGYKIYIDVDDYRRLSKRYGKKIGYILCEVQAHWHRQRMHEDSCFGRGPKRRLRDLIA